LNLVIRQIIARPQEIPQKVIFEGLDQAGVEELLGVDQGFWRSAELPRCDNCHIGFWVKPKEVC